LRAGMCAVFAYALTLKFQKGSLAGESMDDSNRIVSPRSRANDRHRKQSIFIATPCSQLSSSPRSPPLRVTAHQNDDNAWDHLQHDVAEVQLAERCLKVSLHTSEHRTKVTTEGERSAGERGVRCARAGGAPGAGPAEHCCTREL